MIKVAIVDDDKAICDQLISQIEKLNFGLGFDFRVECYMSCEDIYKSMSNGNDYDLIFLDIEFPDMNGTEFGSLLRKRMKNFDTQIIFISSVRDYAMDLFKIRPIEFLVKPIDDAKLKNCMLEYLTLIENTDGFLEYNFENTKHRIRIREVVYLESQRKKTAFHNTKGYFEIYGKVTDIIGENMEKFLCISRGVYVNVQHIVEVTSKEIKLTNGEVLAISRGCQDKVRDRLAAL